MLYDVHLHNDDIHTFDEVIDALLTCCKIKHQQGKLHATAVHKNGHSIVLAQCEFEKAIEAYYALRCKGLITSIYPHQLHHSSQLIVQYELSWMMSFAQKGEQFADIIVTEICKTFEGNDTKQVSDENTDNLLCQYDIVELKGIATLDLCDYSSFEPRLHTTKAHTKR